MLLPEAPVSIDIGSFSVKVAQASGGRGGVRALRFAEQRLPEGFHWEAGADARPLVEAIRQALRRAGIRARRAILALPRRHVIVRISAFPPADRGQLQRVVEVDLADHLPFPVDQVVVDFQPMGPSREQPGLQDVLMVAAQREVVRQYLELARALGMKVAALTIDSFALHDLVSQRQETTPGVQIAIEVGRRATTINIAEGSKLRLTRSIPLGSLQLTTALREDLGLSPEEAEIRRLTEGLQVLAQRPRPARTAAWVDNLRGEVRRTALSFGQAAITRIYLAGAAAHTPGLAAALEAEFGLAPILLSPASLFPTAQLRGADPGMAERCLLAMGLALRGIGRSGFAISLIPREVTTARREATAQRLVGAGALVLAGLLALAYLDAQGKVERLRIGHATLTSVLRQMKAGTGEAKDLQETVTRLNGDLRELTPAQSRRYAVLELLKTISEGADREIILTNFALRPQQPLILRGTAPDWAAAADLQAALLRSRLVTRVSLDRVDRQSQTRVPTRSVLPPLGRSQDAKSTTTAGRKGPGPAPSVARETPPEARVTFMMTVHLRTEKMPKSRRTLAAMEGRR